MRLSRTVLLTAVVLSSLVCGMARSKETRSIAPAEKRADVTAIPRLPLVLHDALQDQRFAEAIKLIDALLDEPKPPPADYLLYLKGRAQTELKLFDRATATFAALEQKYPESRWIPRARFGRADVFVRQRNYRAAGEIYQAEAHRLLEGRRRDELTGIYLEFADRYFDGLAADGPGDAKKPDYRQAAEYYSQALTLRPTRARRQRIELRIARCHHELEEHPQAVQAYQGFLKKHASDDTTSEDRAPVSLEVEARYQLGRAQLAASQAVDARQTWQDFLADEKMKNAAGDLLAQASFQISRTYGVPQPPTVGDLELAAAAADKFLKAYPDHELAPQAEFEIAQSFLHHGRHQQAVVRLKSLIENQAYAQSTYVASARKLLGESYFAQKRFDDAIAAWREFLDAHPSNRNWSEVQRRLIDCEFYAAVEQRSRKKYDAARKLWMTFLNKYPLDGRAPAILLQFGHMKYASAVVRRADERKQSEKKPGGPAAASHHPASGEIRRLFEEAIDDWRRLVSKYPGSGEASKAAFMIGVTLEDQLARLEDALKAYEKVTGEMAGQAKRRISQLTSEQLELLTERKFRSDQSPSIQLTTRNIEKVTVKVYRVDMTDYFRKMHLASGVELLDIALIDPDKSWDYTVDGYEQFAQLVNTVRIPVEGPGVTAVTVSSDKLEATTMVVVSDLDIIVKSSRNELFIFAENMRTQTPVEGVTLLVSDGEEVFAEEVTGADGLLQKSYEELKTIDDLRVFAIHEGHAASTVNSLSGLDFAVGLSPKGYLYTDRPAYRARELVHLKGLIRWVANDRYTFREGEKYRLNVYDPRGRVIHTAEVALNEFGTFSEHFLIPESVPQGECRVHLHQPAEDRLVPAAAPSDRPNREERPSPPASDTAIQAGKQSYETRFQIHAAQLEPLRISVELPRNVYYRGEKIEGTITLKYYYGTPLSGRTVQYQLEGDRMHTAETNDRGEIAFEFPTERFSESQPLLLTAHYPERGLAVQERLFLATRGFEIGLETLRNVYLAGETFDVTINVSDPSGKPPTAAGKAIAIDLKLEVFEETRIDGRRGERLVETHELKSDADKGTARQTLRIASSGRYVLRATGTDRFGNQVSGSHILLVSGEKDKIRLRILADAHHHKVGDTARVQIHWREGPALALVTYEGAQVLGHQLVRLKPGANPLEIPIGSELAPNFMLGVAVMHDRQWRSPLQAAKPGLSGAADEFGGRRLVPAPPGRFHHAQSEFRVTRRLHVELKPNRTTLRPGDELKVDVTVTDPQGRPVSAELSLALIQQNLLDYFAAAGEASAVVEEFFGGGYRKPSVRAASSVAFRYQPTTRGISSALLAEADRRSILEMEARAREELATRAASEFETTLSMIVGVEDRERAGELLDEDGVFDLPSELSIPELVTNEGAGIPSAFQRVGGGAFGGGGDAFGLGRNGRLPQDGFGAQQEQLGQIDSKSNAGYFFSGRGRGRGSRRRILLGTRLQRSDQPARPGIVGLSGRPESNPAELFFQQDGASRLAPYNFGNDFMRRQLATGGLVPVNELTRQYAGTLLFLSNDNGNVVGLNKAGELQIVGGLPVGRLREMADDGLQVLPATSAAETGYWNPVVVTGDDGKASVAFRLPERSTAWRLQSTGIDTDTLCGQADIEIVTKKELFGEMKTPLAFIDGDRANLLVEIHNSAVGKGETIEVRLKTTLGERTTELRKSLTSTGPGIQELSFPVDITAGESVEFELSVASGERSDVAQASVPVQPYGMPVFAVTSGSAAQNTIAYVAHDKALTVEQPKLEILIGPSVDRTLLDAVLGSGLSICERSLPASGLERTVSDVLGGVALLSMVGTSRETDTPEAAALAGRVQSGVSQLVSAQRDDGGWSWTGRADAQQADEYLTSRIAWAISQARQAGFAVPQETFDKTVQFLKSAFSKRARADREGQAILLHGLAEAGAGDFALANRLYRERNRLSPSGLVHLALVLIRLDRKEMAGDLVDLVRISTDGISASRSDRDSAIQNVVPWMQNGVELRALYLLALEELQPTDAKVARFADWLLSARQGSRWSPEKANGPAVAALARWSARTRHAAEKYTLSVYVNDQLVETLQVDPANDPTRRLEVPAKMLVGGRQNAGTTGRRSGTTGRRSGTTSRRSGGRPQRINFDVEGRGRFNYSAVLSGFVPAETLKSTTQSWRVKRFYEPAKRMYDGEEIPRGFGVLTGSYQSFRNKLTQLPLAQKGEVTLNVYRTGVRNTPGEQLDYLIVTEPLPAGTTVLTDSIRGNFERYEISPGAITFYLGDRPYIGNIHYSLFGYLPGRYRAAPTLVRSFYRPERIAVAESKPLSVLKRGAESGDAYRLTPVELYEFGKRLVAKRLYAQASPHLTELFNKYRLRDEIYQEVVTMLFRTALAADENDRIVQYFEIIKEKHPEVEIDFESILKVAGAYRELGEYERSFLVFRATLEAAFQRESQIAGFLDDRGEFVRSVAVMERLLGEYPPESYIATATYALAQEVYGKGPEAAGDEKLRKARISRVDLIGTAVAMLNHFLSIWPSDPAADQASFSLANALLDLERFERVIARCEKYTERYPKSGLIDSYWYVIGYSRFALGHHEQALKMCKQVAEATRTDPQSGALVAAVNKWQSIYIMGQIFHSLGQPADAIREYERVKTHFADAGEAIDFFTRAAIELPEITTVHPGDETRVPLKFRNVAEANVKVYRIDLLKFGLMQRSLNRITAINLAGIRPYHELTFQLGDGHDYRDREQSLELPLEDEGAYLVVCRGGNLYASGLVLVSPLAVEVQEDPQSQRVRVTVKDVTADRYAGDVHVKVIGSNNDGFVSGETDLRGIFVADAILGTSTVIAKADEDRYAFYRGKLVLGQQPASQSAASAADEESQKDKKESSSRDQLLDNLIRSNTVIQQQQRELYRNLLRNKKQGVKAKSAY